MSLKRILLTLKNRLFLKSLLTQYCLLILLLFNTSSVFAGSVQVEAILFQNLNTTLAPELFSRRNAEATELGKTFSPREQARDRFGFGYETVNELEHILIQPHFEKLQALPQYKVLFYRSWRQPVIAPSHALFVNMDPDPALNIPNIKGTLKISFTRAIEAAVHVVYLHAEDQQKAAVLNEKRLIKLNDLYYFDHPLMGVVLKIRQINTNNEVEVPKSNAVSRPVISSDILTESPANSHEDSNQLLQNEQQNEQQSEQPQD